MIDESNRASPVPSGWGVVASPLPPRPDGTGLAKSILIPLLLALTAPAAPAQDAPPRSPITRAGSDLFRAMLREHQVRPVGLDEYGGMRQSERAELLFVLWDTDPNEGGWLGAAGLTVESGGAALILSNAPTTLAREFDVNPAVPGGAWVTGERVAVPPSQSPPVARRNREAAPPFADLVRPGRSGTGPDKPLLTTAPSVVTARPSEHFQEPILLFPDDARIDDRPGKPAPGPADLLAVGGVGPPENPFRLVVIADPGLLANGPLLDPRAGNWDFALGLVRFLRDTGGKARSRCLFVERGRAVESFDTAALASLPPDIPLPLPNLSAIQGTLLDKANEAAERVQAGDLLDRAAFGTSPAGRDRRAADALRGLAVAAAVWAVWSLLRKVWKARQPLDAPPPPGTRLSPSGPGAYARREDELLAHDNLAEPARAVIREAFREWGASADAGQDLPAVEFPRGPSKSLPRVLEELWRVGFGDTTGRVTVERWRGLEAALGDVRRAAAAGRWRFAPPESGVA